MPQSNKDIIKEINDKLYSPNAKEIPIGHTLSSGGSSNVEEDWNDADFRDDDFGTPRSVTTMKKTRSYAKVFLYLSAVFLVIAAVPR